MKVYVSKQSKKEDTKSTAYSFLLVSILGFLLLILFDLGVLPVSVADYMKIMLNIVMGIMLFIFFVIGVISFRQLKKLGEQADVEFNREAEILSWFRSAYSPADIDENFVADTLNGDIYFKRYEVMTRLLTEQYPDLEEAFLDHLIEELYPEFFEENKN